ncbi:hypothetical protein NP493_168g03000 [Ridgeia piscesae]|uniref:Death domain-containing protein n=1 Tax=Ridgeia piscesae TaxID=27915 RepID=A0AAD9UFC1_RIDPI|nr:hypothetical protein NP493_168g03000 [Ridgeia piscesae]
MATTLTKHAERAADILLQLVAHNNVAEIETCLADGAQWRDIIRYEVPIGGNSKGRLDEALMIKLMSCEVTNITAFHLAALLGLTDIIVTFIEHDVPVDFPLQTSGSTATHLASFAGHTITLQLLLDVYKADVSITDRYGWTALHYAATQGHLAAVQTLLSAGIDLSARDHDGTTAAFRAHINGHEDITSFLRTLGCTDDMFDVPDNKPEPPVYSQPNKAKKTKNPDKSKPAKEPNYVDVDFSQIHTPPQSAAPTVARHQSAASDRTSTVFEQLQAKPMRRSQTLPMRVHGPGFSSKPSVVRRVIRQELEAAFSSPYEEPVKARADTSELFSAASAGPTLQVQELRALMRQEIEKYKNDQLPPAAAPAPANHTYASMDEDPYATLEELSDIPATQAPEPPGKVPPLPPRNQHMMLAALPSDPLVIKEDVDDDDEGNQAEPELASMVMLKSSASANAALSECLPKMAPLLGGQWKQLARVLPIERSASRVEQRIRAIEARHPDDETSQARMALAEWRINQKQDADVDALVSALRKCHMHSLICEVESITQEFVA